MYRSNLKLVLLTLLAGTAGYASIVTTPVGLAPGTQYQLAFVTADAFFATSPNISDYNAVVTSEAALDASLASFDTANGVTWTVIGSTTTVNANANAPSSGLVYTLNGVQVASSANTLYSGSLLAPINATQHGTVVSTLVWTGSNAAGTAAGGINDFGQTFTEFGNTTLSNVNWIANGNGIESNNNIPFYALSSVITVGTPSTAPEPGTWGLMLGAVAVVGALRRRASRARD